MLWPWLNRIQIGASRSGFALVDMSEGEIELTLPLQSLAKRGVLRLLFSTQNLRMGPGRKPIFGGIKKHRP